jgi:hypothetical protein
VSEGCAAPFTGTIEGCNGFPLSGATVTIRRQSDDAVIGSAVTGSDGTYSGTATFPAGETSLGVTATVTHERFVTPEASEHTFTCAGPNVVNITLTAPATGYRCTVYCAWPVAETLYYSDPLAESYGGTWPMPLVYDSGLALWVGQQSLSFPGCAPCGASDTEFYVQFDGEAPFFIVGGGGGNPFCPDTDLEEPSGGAGYVFDEGDIICPEDGFTIPMTISTNGNNTKFYCGNGTTATITE